MRPFALVLVLVGGPARADDPEPPGGTAELRKLKGTWSAVRYLVKGREVKPPAAFSYTFDGDKATVEQGTIKQVLKVKVDTKKKPFSMELTPEGGRGQAIWFKIDKGELFLAPRPPKDFKGDVFKGESALVIVLEKK